MALPECASWHPLEPPVISGGRCRLLGGACFTITFRLYSAALASTLSLPCTVGFDLRERAVARKEVE